MYTTHHCRNYYLTNSKVQRTRSYWQCYKHHMHTRCWQHLYSFNRMTREKQRCSNGMDTIDGLSSSEPQVPFLKRQKFGTEWDICLNGCELVATTMETKYINTQLMDDDITTTYNAATATSNVYWFTARFQFKQTLLICYDYRLCFLIKQVCVQLTAYTDNVALPTFANCCCDNWYLPPAPAAGLLLWAHAGRDRRTDTVPFHRPCSTY